MSDQIQVSLFQYPIVWEEPIANQELIEKYTFGLKTDLLVLPEMFTTGFSMEPQNIAESPSGQSLNWMKILALKLNACVCGSLVIEEENRFYNRFYWVFPTSEVHYYNKRHLFRMAGEHKSYSSGEKSIIIEYKGWKFCPLVCYDLRFPVFSRNKNLAYDLLLYVANWPAKRSFAWTSLLKARAIENQAYVLGVNRVGMDANQIEYSGNSAIYNYLGETVWDNQNQVILHTETLDKSLLQDYRKSFPSWQDADKFTIL